MSEHPNATAAGTTGIIATIILWAAGRLGVHLPETVAVVAAGAAITVVLAVGRNGVKGTWNRIWGGKPQPPAPPAG